MSEWLSAFLPYYLYSLFYTLGAIVICGLAAYFCKKAFVYLTGGGKFVYVTSVIGTPIHELGHAVMCLLFGHKIVEMKLLASPKKAADGALGYVSHSYSKKNPWAVLGNLFIGVGPIFSGLGVIVLTLLLCFPEEWSAYLASTASIDPSAHVSDIAAAVFSLLRSLWSPLLASPVRSLIGFVIILFVAQHVTLSTSDIKGALSALPLYMLLLLIVTVLTMLLGVDGTVLTLLFSFHLKMLSFFALTIAFSLLWLVVPTVLYLIRSVFR